MQLWPQFPLPSAWGHASMADGVACFQTTDIPELFNKRTDDSHKQKSSNKTTILHFCMFGPVGYDQEFSGCYQQRDSDIEESRFSRGAGKQLT